MLSDAIKKMLHALGYRLVARSYPGARTQGLLMIADLTHKIRSNKTLTKQELFIKMCLRYAERSRAQLFQDVLVLYLLGEKRNGVFVEFGACDGERHSNSYMLEKDFKWTGLLAEPARVWHESLVDKRRCTADFRCVWKKSGEKLEFMEALTPELSTVRSKSCSDRHVRSEGSAGGYEVETVTLNDLLHEHDISPGFDYLSIDTEGSETEVLSAFDLARYRPSVLTIEHNHRTNERVVERIVKEHGYERVFRELSAWDAWYVRKEVLRVASESETNPVSNNGTKNSK